MTPLSAQQLFMSVSVLELRFSRLSREYERLSAAITRCTSEYEQPVQAGKPSDKRYDVLIEISKQRDQAWDELIDRRQYCFDLLSRLSDPGWAQVVEYWYLDNPEPTKDKIAERLGVDRSTVYRMHDQAMRELDRMILDDIPVSAQDDFA